jgi:Domain of unknown function (DUF4149)
MRYVLLLLVWISWALWLGATMAVFVFALNLFHTHPAIAAEANSAMFVVFGSYEMILAGIALLATGLLLISFPKKATALLVLCLVLAAGMSLTSGMGFTPRMEVLRVQGQSHSEEFRRLHKKCMLAMTMQIGMLLVCGSLLLVISDKRNESPPDPIRAV